MLRFSYTIARTLNTSTGAHTREVEYKFQEKGLAWMRHWRDEDGRWRKLGMWRWNEELQRVEVYSISDSSTKGDTHSVLTMHEWDEAFKAELAKTVVT